MRLLLEAGIDVNARYGNEPGSTFYTHISDQYAPFHIKLISATVRDATHVLDGLLYHESDLGCLTQFAVNGFRQIAKSKIGYRKN